MTAPEHAPDIIWQGRIHIGDEPGYYGDAAFAGLCFDLPIELMPYSGEYKDGHESEGHVTLILNADGLRPDLGYPGHRVIFFPLAPDETSGAWTEGSIGARGRLGAPDSGPLSLTLEGNIPRYSILRVRADTEIAPGLYQEIVITRLSLVSHSHYAYLGFRYRMNGRVQ